jgi:hypothetical protein
MITMSKKKVGLLRFEEWDGRDTFVSVRAFEYVRIKYKLQPVGDQYKIKDWMIEKMVEYDKAHNTMKLTPEQIEDIRRVSRGETPLLTDDWGWVDPDDFPHWPRPRNRNH